MNNDTTNTPNSKKCNKCGQIKPLTEFYKFDRSADGKGYICRACAHEQYEMRKAKKATTHPTEKACSICGIVKPINEYTKSAISIDGHNPMCKACKSIYNDKYREDNSEKIKKRMAKWYKENREEVRKKQNTRYARIKRAPQVEEKTCNTCGQIKPAADFHTKKDSADGLAYVCRECKQKYDERWQAYYRTTERYVEVNRNGNHRRRARQMGAKGSHTQKEIELIYQQQKGRCYWCQKKLKGIYHADHRIPLSRGGSDDASNIVVACPHCNTSKHNRMPWEWNGRLL